MAFNWDISLGNALTILAFVGGVWKYVNNHMEHMEGRLNDRISEVREDVQELRAHLLSEK